MITRRQFMRRGALLAAGGLALPPWARWLGEQMDKLRPSRRVVVAPTWHPVNWQAALESGNYTVTFERAQWGTVLVLRKTLEDGEPLTVRGLSEKAELEEHLRECLRAFDEGRYGVAFAG